MPLPIATSIHLFFDAAYQRPITEQIRLVIEAGFRHLDFNFIDWVNDARSPFVQDGWRAWIQEAVACAQQQGATFVQAHAPMPLGPMSGPVRYRAMCVRAIEAAGMLGVPWMVFHLCPAPQEGHKASAARVAHSRTFFESLLPLCEKHHVGIAIEDFTNDDFAHPTVDELIALVDSLPDGSAGVCWDTGHANIAKVDQAASLRALGHRLKRLHLADNAGQQDEHLAPFYGNIDWRTLLRTLGEIGYTGPLTFEAHNHVRRLPEDCKGDAVRLLYRIGENMANIVEVGRKG